MSSDPDPACERQGTLLNRFEEVAKIWEIIDRLRDEGGCPWDRKQTPPTVQTYLVEEAHEAAAAVRAGHTAEACEELGDLLFMVLFMIHLYEESRTFRLEEVCAKIAAKMIRRHPHVFGDISVETAEDVRDNWEKIKAEEGAAKGKEDGLAEIPATLPALMRAYRILSRLAQHDPVWSDVDTLAQQFSLEADALSRALPSGSPAIPEIASRLLLLLVGIQRLSGQRAEDGLHLALDELLRQIGEKSRPIQD